jgi:hypothetical protein
MGPGVRRDDGFRASNIDEVNVAHHPENRLPGESRDP